MHSWALFPPVYHPTYSLVYRGRVGQGCDDKGERMLLLKQSDHSAERSDAESTCIFPKASVYCFTALS